MSCRENNGNSAATSLAKFLTGSEEKLVSHIFHVARREGAIDLGDTAKEYADKNNVLEFLTRAHYVARHDARIPDARRANLINRIEGAEEDIQAGRLKKWPSKATFVAWNTLQERLELENAVNEVHVEEMDPNIGFTPEGIAISGEEVNIALLDLNRLQATLAKKKPLPASETPPTFNKTPDVISMAAFEVDLAREKYERLLVAYDATDTGYNNLIQNIKTAENHEDEEALKDLLPRLASAEEQRTQTSLLSLTLAEAKVTGHGVARENFDIARTLAKNAEKEYRDNPQDKDKLQKYEDSNELARKTRRIYLYTLLDDSTIKTALSHRDALSPQIWSTITGNEKVDRVVMWAAVDLYLSDRDNVEVRLGRLRDGEVANKSFSRAQARQALLDAEGNGAIDTINRRHFESVSRKRGVSGKSLAR